MSWGAVIVGVAAVAGAVISSNASSDAAEAQAAGLDKSTDIQLQMASMAAGAQIEGARMGAEAIRDSARMSSETQMAMYEQTRADQLPWLTAGQKALKQLQGKISRGPGEFEEDPGYKFRLSEGNKNILANASATGSVASGRALKAIESYGQDYASNEYDKFIDRYYQSLAPLQSLAGVGQNTATNLGVQGNQVASSVASTQQATGASLANIYNNAGISAASGYTNAGNITANNYMGQANIAANSSINNANAWTSALNTGAGLAGAYLGGQGGNSAGIFGSGTKTLTPYNYGTSQTQTVRY